MDSTSSCDRSYRSAILHILLYSEGMKITPKCEEFTSFFTYYFPDLTDMVQFLVSKGANVNARDQSLFTVLHMASESGNFSLEKKGNGFAHLTVQLLFRSCGASEFSCREWSKSRV